MFIDTLLVFYDKVEDFHKTLRLFYKGTVAHQNRII